MDMKTVKQFNAELTSLYDQKPPISKVKMTALTKGAIRAIKFYKHVVQSVEKFLQKCRVDYKVPGLYVIDSIVRQSRHQFGVDRDVFAPRFAKNLSITFYHIFKCPSDDKSKVIRVLNLWQKNQVFQPEIIQPIFDLADPDHPSSRAIEQKLACKPPELGEPGCQTSSGDCFLSSGNHQDEGGGVDELGGVMTPDPALVAQLQQLQTLLKPAQPSQCANPCPDEFTMELEEGGGGGGRVTSLDTSLDSLSTLLSNPDVVKQLQSLQQTLQQQQQQQQCQQSQEQSDRARRLRQREDEFDRRLAQTVGSLPFASEIDFQPAKCAEPTFCDTVSTTTDLPSLPAVSTACDQDMRAAPPVFLLEPETMATEAPVSCSDVDDRVRPCEEKRDSVRRSRSRSWRRRARSRSSSRSRSKGSRRSRRSRSRDRDWSRDRSRRSRSRNYSRRSRSRDHERSRRSWSRDQEEDKGRQRQCHLELERKRKGLPPRRVDHLSVCSTTLWVGHLSKLVQQENLSDLFGRYGDVVSIDLIPPRGCAFVCMSRRQDASHALAMLKNHRLQGKVITIAWAVSKGMKGRDFKDYWEIDSGCSYIPYSKLSVNSDLRSMEEGGMLDEDSLPDWLKERFEELHSVEAVTSKAECFSSTSSGPPLPSDPAPAPRVPQQPPLPSLPVFVPAAPPQPALLPTPVDIPPILTNLPRSAFVKQPLLQLPQPYPAATLSPAALPPARLSNSAISSAPEGGLVSSESLLAPPDVSLPPPPLSDHPSAGLMPPVSSAANGPLLTAVTSQPPPLSVDSANGTMALHQTPKASGRRQSRWSDAPSTAVVNSALCQRSGDGAPLPVNSYGHSSNAAAAGGGDHLLDNSWSGAEPWRQSFSDSKSPGAALPSRLPDHPPALPDLSSPLSASIFTNSLSVSQSGPGLPAAAPQMPPMPPAGIAHDNMFSQQPPVSARWSEVPLAPDPQFAMSSDHSGPPPPPPPSSLPHFPPASGGQGYQLGAVAMESSPVRPADEGVQTEGYDVPGTGFDNTGPDPVHYDVYQGFPEPPDASQDQSGVVDFDPNFVVHDSAPHFEPLRPLRPPFGFDDHSPVGPHPAPNMMRPRFPGGPVGRPMLPPRGPNPRMPPGLRMPPRGPHRMGPPGPMARSPMMGRGPWMDGPRGPSRPRWPGPPMAGEWASPRARGPRPSGFLRPGH